MVDQEGKLKNGTVTFMAVKSQFTEEVWEMLLFAPFWVMEIVSKADGITDVGEKKIFYEEINRLARESDSSLVGEIFLEINKNLEEISSELSRDKRDPAYAMLDVRGALDGLPDDLGGEDFCDALFIMAINIADASGSMTNSGRRIEQAELRALAGLAVLLEINLEKHEELEEKEPKFVFQIHGYLKRIESSVM